MTAEALQRMRALVPLLPDDEYRRRKRLLLATAISALLAVISLFAVFGTEAFAQHPEHGWMLVALTFFCLAMLFGVASLGLIMLWCSQRAARFLRTFPSDPEGRTS